ncbi:MAG: YcxB family protein, partial [Propionicimonas sp.]
PYRKRAREALARTGADRRVWLDADGLIVAVGSREEHVAWSGITRVVETGEHVFVFTGPNAAHVIPRRVGEPQLREFLDALRARVGR